MGKRNTGIEKVPGVSGRSSASILDEGRSEWNEGYDQNYRRIQVVTFLDNVVFDNVAGTWTSKEFRCAPYSKFTLLANVKWTLTPTNLQIFVEVSDDAVNWFEKTDGPFGSLLWAPAQGDRKESVDGDIRVEWSRMRAVVVGSSAVNKCNLTGKIVFNT